MIPLLTGSLHASLHVERSTGVTLPREHNINTTINEY